MGKSSIEWTDYTWNPVRGCRKISPGCKHCYAEVFAERFRGVKGHHYERGFDPRLAPDQLGLPLTWSMAREIFVNSMSDLYLEEFDPTFIAAVIGVMGLACHHTYQVLTKRAEYMEAFKVDQVIQLPDEAAALARHYVTGEPVQEIKEPEVEVQVHRLYMELPQKGWKEIGREELLRIARGRLPTGARGFSVNVENEGRFMLLVGEGPNLPFLTYSSPHLPIPRVPMPPDIAALAQEVALKCVEEAPTVDREGRVLH